jgi:hypothetical protein
MFKAALFLVILLESCSSFRYAFTRSTYRRDTTCMSSILSENWESSLKSPCKLNLFLRILGKRDTGFHELASLFQCITLSDYMYFSRLPEDSIRDEMTCSDSSLAVDDSNLVIKALSLMRNKTGYVFIRIYMCVSVYICILYAYIYICIYVYIYMYTYICMYVYICFYKYVYVYIY